MSAQTSKQIYLQRADSLLQQILLYKVEKYGLLTETYPRNPEQRITYTANTGAVVNQQEVSFLWPYSALVSGCVSLYKVSGQKKYRKLMDRQIKPDWTFIGTLPGFPIVTSRIRLLQVIMIVITMTMTGWPLISVITMNGLVTRSIWKKPSSCMTIFIPDGPKSWGGIYWCEQKKESKILVLNAPATVLCMKLFKLTKDAKYLEQAKKTYQWTRDNLCDPSDFVYWDNKNLQEKWIRPNILITAGR